MSRLSKTDTYAIQWLNYQNFSSLEIANELKISEKQIIKVLEKASRVNSTNNIKNVTEPATEPSKNLFILESQNKKNKGVAIMTKEASEKADSERVSISNTSTRRTENIIYKPKN